MNVSAERHRTAPAYVPIGERDVVRVLPRPAEAGDISYVLDTWVKSWRQSAHCRRMTGRDYRDMFKRQVREGLLREPDTRITIGCDETSPSRIWSWVCWTPGRAPALHFAYTRASVDGVPLRTGDRGAGMLRVLASAIGVRDALIYTMEPITQALGAHLLAAAERNGIATLHRPIGEWLDLRSGT